MPQIEINQSDSAPADQGGDILGVAFCSVCSVTSPTTPHTAHSQSPAGTMQSRPPPPPFDPSCHIHFQGQNAHE